MNEQHMLRLPAVLKIVGISRATIYRWIEAGNFPAPIRLGPNSVAWKSTTIYEWLDTRAANAEVAS